MSHFSFSIEQLSSQATTWEPNDVSQAFNDVIDPLTDFKVSSAIKSTTDSLLPQNLKNVKYDLKIDTNLEPMKNATPSAPNVPSVHGINKQAHNFEIEKTQGIVGGHHVVSETLPLHKQPDAESIHSFLDDSDSSSTQTKEKFDIMEQLVNKKLHQYPAHEITTYRERRSYLSDDSSRVKEHGAQSISSESGFSDSLSFERLKENTQVAHTSSTPDKLAQDAHMEFSSWMDTRVASLSSPLNASVLENQTLRKDYESLILKMQKEEKDKYDDLLKAHSNMEEHSKSMKQDIREFIGERSGLLKMISSLQADVRILEDKLMEADEKISKLSSESAGIENISDVSLEKTSSSKFSHQIKLLRGTLECKETALSLLKQTHAETIRDLHQNIAANVQSQGEVASLRSEVAALERSRSWYKEQLLQSQATKNELRQELMDQRQLADSQTSLSEKMKNEVAVAKQQLVETEKRAEIHRQTLTQQLRRIEEDLRVDTFDSGNEEVLLRRLKELEEERSEAHILNFKISDLQQQLSTATSKLVAREDSLVNAEHENKQLHATVTHLNKQITAKNMDIQQLENRNATASHAINDIKSEKEETENQLERSKTKADSLQSALTAANDEKRQVDSVVVQLKTELVKIVKKFKRFQNELAEKDRIIATLTAQNQFLAKPEDTAQNVGSIQVDQLSISTPPRENQSSTLTKDYGGISIENNRIFGSEGFDKQSSYSVSKLSQECSKASSVSNSNFPDNFKLLMTDESNGRVRDLGTYKKDAEKEGNLKENDGLCSVNYVSSLNEPKYSEIPVIIEAADSLLRISLCDVVKDANTSPKVDLRDSNEANETRFGDGSNSKVKKYDYEKMMRKCLELEEQLSALREAYEENRKEVAAKTRDIEAMLTQIATLERCVEEETYLNKSLKENIEKELRVKEELEKQLREKKWLLDSEKTALEKQLESVQDKLHRVVEKGKDREERLAQMLCLQQELKESRIEKENLQNTQNVLEERVKSMEEYAYILNQKMHSVELERNKLSEELSRCKPEVVEALSAEPDVIQNTCSGTSFSVAVQTDSFKYIEQQMIRCQQDNLHSSEDSRTMIRCQQDSLQSSENSRTSSKTRQLLEAAQTEMRRLLSVSSKSEEECYIDMNTLANILKDMENFNIAFQQQHEKEAMPEENQQLQRVGVNHAALGVQQTDFDIDCSPPSPTPLDQELIQDLLERNCPGKMNSETMAQLYGCLQSLNDDVKKLNERINR